MNIEIMIKKKHYCRKIALLLCLTRVVHQSYVIASGHATQSEP